MFKTVAKGLAILTANVGTSGLLIEAGKGVGIALIGGVLAGTVATLFFFHKEA